MSNGDPIPQMKSSSDSCPLKTCPGSAAAVIPPLTAGFSSPLMFLSYFRLQGALKLCSLTARGPCEQRSLWLILSGSSDVGIKYRTKGWTPWESSTTTADVSKSNRLLSNREIYLSGCDLQGFEGLGHEFSEATRCSFELLSNTF